MGNDVLMLEGERDGDGNEGEKHRSRVLFSVRPFGILCTARDVIC